VDRAVAQQGSHDSQIHLDPAIKRPCGSTPGVVTADGCGALANERCASERYPSGRPRYFFSGFHPGR
jgi:hypothetical protein